MTGKPWSEMTPRENIEARARLFRNAARRHREQGNLEMAQIQERSLSRLCGEAERDAAELAALDHQEPGQ